MRADLPGAAGPTLRAQARVDLLADVLDLVVAQAEPLRDVPPGLVAAPHPEDVPVVEVSLVVPSEWRVRVRVLGQLEDRIRHWYSFACHALR